MLSGLLVCVLVVGAVASKPGMPSGAARGGLQVGQEEPERCCAPRYFTADHFLTSTTVKEGKLSVEIDEVNGAYDAVFERLALKVVVDYLNGTEVHLKFIGLYEEGVTYTILEHQGESVCFKGETQERFHEDCLTEDFKFIGKTTLGDFDMVVENWYRVSEDGTAHTVKSVQEEGCTPVGALTRMLDSVTGDEIAVLEARTFNFELGICDPEEFKPPESCDEGRALKKPSPEMVKFHSKNILGRL
ncbi:mammalian ependymin-related protein 1-like [Patiria miniata]|uniref:Uncharacterized protein n=1 Tax=Patiria miniata TaxID=46514 RepID=A0A914B0X9_PATMI|nr:mammalian ependymin-related protein 1-like [Patiria miniata]